MEGRKKFRTITINNNWCCLQCMKNYLEIEDPPANNPNAFPENCKNKKFGLDLDDNKNKYEILRGRLDTEDSLFFSRIGSMLAVQSILMMIAVTAPKEFVWFRLIFSIFGILISFLAYSAAKKNIDIIRRYHSSIESLCTLICKYYEDDISPKFDICSKKLSTRLICLSRGNKSVSQSDFFVSLSKWFKVLWGIIILWQLHGFFKSPIGDICYNFILNLLK